MVARVTMSDVGRVAGVSHQTVSRVLNEPHRVTAETRERVTGAIQQLKFHRSSVARALATNRTKSIGLVSIGHALHSHSKRMIGFNEAARASGYQVSMASLATADPLAMQTAVNGLLGQSVEGLILIAADKQALEVIDTLDVDVPMIIADSGGDTGRDHLAIDQFVGARVATAHLADQGHEVIAHVPGPDWSLDAGERRRGWHEELTSRGLASPELLEGDWSPESGYRRGLSIASKGLSTAVFCGNDQIALGLLHAFNTRGVRVPDDISVVGFDDIPEAAHFIPPLTTIRQDFVQLGFRVVSALINRIENTEMNVTPGTDPELIIRESTARRSQLRK